MMTLPEDPSGPRKKWTHVAWLLLGVCLGAAMVVGVWILVWDTEGQARKTSRQSALMMMRNYLEQEAQRLGHYPLRLEDVDEVRDYILEGEAQFVEYVAAGKPYSQTENPVVLRETVARHYGFKRGWWEIYHYHTVFHSGDAPRAAPAEPKDGSPMIHGGAARETVP